jgi:hypothetical protein
MPEIQAISGKENQEMFNDIWWQLCHDGGRADIKKWMRDSARSVALEAQVLEAQALAILKRECFLVDPTGKTGDTVGTTTLAKKVNWMAHNDAQILGVLIAIGDKLGIKLDTLIEAHIGDEALEESLPQVELPPVVPEASE